VNDGAVGAGAGGESVSEAVRAATERVEIGGLRRRFVLAIAVLVAVVLLTQAAVLWWFGRRHFRQETEERASSYSRLAVDPVCDAYQTYFDSGFSKFRELVGEIAELDPDLEGLRIYDVDGELLFDSDELDRHGRPAEPPRRPTAADPRLLTALGGLEPTAWRETGEGERRYVVVAPHIEEWGRHRYSVVFRFSYQGLAKATWGVGWQLGGLALLALALGVGCAFVLSAQALGPVARLTAGARRLAEGELRHRIGLRTGDEFEVLGATLDQMAARLADTVDDLEETNRRLGELNRELEQLDRVKSDLLANVSHELRTPLTAIGGYVEAFQAGLLGEVDDGQRRALAVVERNLRRLRGMIDQLLSYARMQSEGLEVELGPFDLGAVAKHVVEAVTAAHGPELRLDFRCPEELPEVYGDPSRIGQVIENLVTNAVKFSPRGEPIDLHLLELPEGVEVVVRDRGIGIPKEYQGKIFDRFYQVDATSKRHFGGIGLGLAIVREILELNHCEIRVESEPGEGSAFRFVLPLASERTGMLPTLGRRRVVIVDDDAGFVQRLAAHLSGRGWVVETAAGVEPGWATIRRVRPHAVVLDRLLPDGDGFDLLQRLNGRPATRRIPVLLVTVRAERALGLRLGAAAYLRKPIDAGEVERRLEEVVEEADG